MRPIHVAGTKGKGSTSALISSILVQYVDNASITSSLSSSTLKGESMHGSGVEVAPAFKLRKIGLYTSPHLRSVRERIRINNEPLSEPAFAKYFFEIWDRLEDAARAKGEDPSATGVKPMYFRYLTLMALHAYMAEGVDSAVVECGIGGEYDATNILVQPTVTAVTSLGIDHVDILGSTLRDIAWHKSGIFKPGAQALTVPQSQEALEVLRRRADERGVDLHVVERSAEVDALKLGLAADFQKTNANLAVAVAAVHLRKLGHPEANQLPRISGNGAVESSPLPPEFRHGLERVRLAGRCDIRRESDQLTWYIDGGHTMDSVRIAGEWYVSCTKPSMRNPISNGHTTASSTSATVTRLSPNRILIFNQQSRDALALAKTLFATLADGLAENDIPTTANTITTSTNSTTRTTPSPSLTVNSTKHPRIQPITHAFFSTNVTYRQNGYKPDLVSINADADAVQALSVQHALASLWKELDPECDVRVFGTVEEAVAAARGVAGSGGGVGTGRAEEIVEDKKEDAGTDGTDGTTVIGTDKAIRSENLRTEAFVTGSLHLVGGLLEVLEGTAAGSGAGAGMEKGMGTDSGDMKATTKKKKKEEKGSGSSCS